jgi:thiamine biosynthesis protein ThiI
MRCAIVHYHELALKGRNRPYFEQRLVRHLRLALRDLGVKQVDALTGRIRVGLGKETPWEPVKTRLARTFGIAHFSLAQSVPLGPTGNLAPLKAAIGEAVRDLPFATFRVSSKRADKRFPLTSMEVDREIGAHVCALTGKRVNLRQPDLTIAVEMLTKEIFFSVQR